MYMLLILCSPVFPGLYDFCSIYTGATLEGAVKLNSKVSGVCGWVYTLPVCLYACILNSSVSTHNSWSLLLSVLVYPLFQYRSVISPSIGLVAYIMPRSLK